MTRRLFMRWVSLILVFYMALLLLGLLSYFLNEMELFKGISPILTALPAVWLTAVVQRRLSFLQQLRSIWTELLKLIQDVVQYTHKNSFSPQEFGDLHKRLSILIDDFRSIFRNLEEGDNKKGYFPFESLKEIVDCINQLPPGCDPTPEHKAAIRQLVMQKWMATRKPILNEFDRIEPTFFNVIGGRVS